MCLFGCSSESGDTTSKQGGAAGKEKTATGTGTSNGGAAATCAPFVIKSETVATTPGARTRTRIGIGEEVNLTTDPSTSVTWTIESDDGQKGTLGTASGNSSQYTACDRGGKTVTIKAESACGRTDTHQFTVVQPSSAHFVGQADISSLTTTTAKAGFTGTVYAMPADVSFYNIDTTEGACQSTGTGVFSHWNNISHSLYPWFPSTSTVNANGTEQGWFDTCDTGTLQRTALNAATTGSHQFLWPIPWICQVRGGGTNGTFTIQISTHNSTWAHSSRVLQVSKAGSTQPLTVPP